MKQDDPLKPDAADVKRVDDWLRRGLAPESATLERLVRRSLRAAPSSRARGRRLALVGVAATVALVAAFLFFLPRERESAPEARAATSRGSIELLTITNESGSIEVLYPTAGATGPTSLPADPPHRSRTITIFNSNGLVAAIVPAPISHHFILGGES